MNYWTQSKDNIYVSGHRGWKGKYPENTMEGFRAVLELDIDQIETDVRITKDGELVLIHDDTVDRTTNGTGKVCDFTLAELKELDAGNGAKIPTLIEFMDLVKDHPTLTINIELKEYPTEGWEEVSYSVCDRVLKIIEDYDFVHRSIITIFSGKLHEYIKDKYGDKFKQHMFFPQRFLGECTIDPYSYGYCTCVFGVVKGYTTIEEAKNLQKETGIRLWASSATKDEETVDRAIAYGAELITCDNPDEILAILKKKNKHK